jgi:hypothetical protein
MATLTQEINSHDAGAATISRIDQKIEVTIFPAADGLPRVLRELDFFQWILKSQRLWLPSSAAEANQRR